MAKRENSWRGTWLPDHLVILGGGYVGLEFAQAMRRFGSRVTIIQRGKQLLQREDADVADAVLHLMHEEGIEVLLQADVLNVTGRSGSSVKLEVRAGSTAKTLEASDILVAAGRTPNTDRLDVAQAGVDLDSRGYIRVNEKLQTSAADVWAMGDCAGSPQFTHVGYDDFRVVLDNLNGGSRTTQGRLIPYCLFTDPELAHVGLSESDARARNVAYRIARLPMSMVLRTRTLSQTRGFVKALIGADDRILGFTAFGAEASEMLAAVQTAMLGGMPYTALRDAIFAHPTAVEGLVALFAKSNISPVTSPKGGFPNLPGILSPVSLVPRVPFGRVAGAGPPGSPGEWRVGVTFWGDRHSRTCFRTCPNLFPGSVVLRFPFSRGQPEIQPALLETQPKCG